YTLERKIRGAFMYPSVIIGVMVIVGFLMFVYVVPKLTGVFKDFNVDLPLSTRLLVALSDLISNHALLFAGGMAGIVALVVVLLRTPQGRRGADFLLLRLPGVAPLIREANTARVGQTLSSLLSAGVPVVGALEVTADVIQNSFYKEVLLEAQKAIQKGEPLSSVFEKNERIYPPFLSEMVAVGEETGKLSQMLKDTGDFFSSEVDQKTKDLSTIIEPVLMVFVGVAVGFFAVAMMSPAYSLMNSI
ncbi:MAG: type II secretion system F family protein, partial [bacterium]|nr:type II secretion system F family protein [bacterium]